MNELADFAFQAKANIFVFRPQVRNIDLVIFSGVNFTKRFFKGGAHRQTHPHPPKNQLLKLIVIRTGV